MQIGGDLRARPSAAPEAGKDPRTHRKFSGRAGKMPTGLTPTGLTPTGLTPTGLAQVSGKRDTINTRPVSVARSTDGPLWTIIIKGIAGAGALAYRPRVVTNGMATRTP